MVGNSVLVRSGTGYDNGYIPHRIKSVRYMEVVRNVWTIQMERISKNVLQRGGFFGESNENWKSMLYRPLGLLEVTSTPQHLKSVQDYGPIIACCAHSSLGEYRFQGNGH